MKKTRVYKNINRNTNKLFNHVNRTSRMNTISPEVLVGSLWLQEDNPNGVQIIELDSSNSDGSPKDSQDYNNFSHAWSYINNDRFQQSEDKYVINKKARERRRLKNNNRNLQPNSSLESSNGYETENPNFISNHIDKNNPTLNHQMNCFTIINKHIIDSDTASDNPEYDDIEYLAPRNYFPENERWVDRSNAETNEPEHDQEKRTIWIYSFKNKHLLSDNDFRHENLSSKETTSCSTSRSSENIEEENSNYQNTSACRVATPIPASYVPRLNLSLGPTLPTVSEVTEPSTVFIHSSESVRSMKNEVIKRKQNSWFTNDHKIDGSDTVLKQDTSTNVIEWMSLSPRERRRRFKISNVNKKLPTLPEANSYTETMLKNIEIQHRKLKQNEISQVVVDVDVHIADGPKKTEAKTPPNDVVIVTKINADDVIDKKSSDYDDQENGKDDRGDHTRKSIFWRPKIQLGPKIRPSPKHKMDESKISDPIDNLESDNWILEDEEKQPALPSHDCDVNVTVKLPQVDENENSASRRLWRRNLSLMKPPQWTEYLPISESPLFLHLSLDSFDEIKQPWYQRMFKYFKCCT